MSTLDTVVSAARRWLNELLDQASKYERLGQPQVANETMNDHYLPLKHAIDTLVADYSHRALWFTPDAIREHFADDDGEIAEAIAAATDEQLRAIGEDALQADVIYREFHDELVRSATDVLLGDEQPEPPEREPDLPMPGDRP